MRLKGASLTAGFVGVAALAVVGLAGVPTHALAAVTPDTKIGEALLGDSGETTVINQLATFAGVDASNITKVLDGDASDVQVDNSTFFIDVDPDEPIWFVLKFGIGGTSATADHFFFENIAELTKLAWTNSQVQNLMSNFSLDEPLEGRLSFYRAYVPLPAAAWLLLTALGSLFGLRWWRGRGESAVPA